MYFLPFTFLVPLFSFVTLYFFNDSLSRRQTITVGIGSIFISVMSVAASIFSHLSNYESGTVVGVILWQWTKEISLSNSFGLAFDGLSIMLTGLITLVGLLVNIYTVWHMQYSKGLAKLLGFNNLLLASMLIVVLSDNLLFLYLGWKGIGLSCYLILTGFTKNNLYPSYLASKSMSTSTALVVASEVSKRQAQIKQQQQRKINKQVHHTANKWFILNHIGYLCLAFALILIAKQFSTLSIVEITNKAPNIFAKNTPVLVVITSLLAIATIAKSAQLPLHTWLIRVSSGFLTPTFYTNASLPSSTPVFVPFLALIQSLTVGLVGVYLITRFHPLFILTPDILTWWIGFIGAMTIVIGALSASVQTDINRVLAYSTMSQVGFIFVALGVGAWKMAVFHLFVHSVVKLLLVLTAGAVTHSVNEETNILKMGGVRHTQPLLFLAFVIGGGALIGLPFITIGYFSLDAILLQTYFFKHKIFFIFAIIGVFWTAFYVCRLGWHIFFGKQNTKTNQLPTDSNLSYKLPLTILMILSTTIGSLLLPYLIALLENVLPTPSTASFILADTKNQNLVNFIMVSAITAGITLAWALYVANKSRIVHSFTGSNVGSTIVQLCYQGFGFDALYNSIYQYFYRLLFVKKTVETGLETVGSELEHNKELQQNNSFQPRYMIMSSFAMTIIVLTTAFMMI